MSKPTFVDPMVGRGAGQCELIYAESGAVLAQHVEPAFDSKARKKGLLGRESIPGDYALIIAPCSAVHTFFMRTPIDLIYVTRNGHVTKTRRSVQPWRMSGDLRAFAVIEAAPGFIERSGIVPGEIVALREIANKRRATDTLPPLAATGTTGPGAAPARHTTSHTRVTLADVIARKTPLEWFESVAIVQELCETVLGRGPAGDPRVPELKHITLTPDGSIALLAEGPAEHSPVHRATLVLLALTPGDQLPVQLRLLALEEVSPRPRLTSLKELHAELEFYERPDRLAIVRGVYERFQHLSAQPPAEAAVPPALLEPPLPKERWWKRRSVRAGAWIVVLMLAAAAGLWAWQRPEGQWMRTGVAQVSRAASAASQKAIQAARDEWAGARRRWESRQGEPVPVAPVSTGAGPSPQDRPADSSRMVQQGGGTPPPALPPIDLARSALAPAPDSAAPAGGAPGAAVAASDVEGRSQAVYSSSDPQVVPPTLVSPSLPAGPRPGARPESLPEFELLISTTGEVEMVRLVSGPAGTQAGMMVSAIKNWRFQPATREGQPVKYRQRMRLPIR